MDILSSYQENAADFLASRLDHKDKNIRKFILDTLVNMKGELSLRVIRASLRDNDINIVITAVEYLARLEDKASLPVMLELFEKKKEPMLRITILDAIGILGSQTEFEKVISILMLDKAYPVVNSIYFSPLIRLAGKTGTEKQFMDFVLLIKNPIVYANDILSACFSLINKNFQKTSFEILFPVFKQIYEADLNEETKFSILEMISVIPGKKAESFIRIIMEKTDRSELKKFCRDLLEKRG